MVDSKAMTQAQAQISILSVKLFSVLRQSSSCFCFESLILVSRCDTGCHSLPAYARGSTSNEEIWRRNDDGIGGSRGGKSRNAMDLDSDAGNRMVSVTGAVSYLGLAIVKRLLAHGYSVMYSRSNDALAKVMSIPILMVFSNSSCLKSKISYKKLLRSRQIYWVSLDSFGMEMRGYMQTFHA